VGRLFDAAAALLYICETNSYEGECAVRLEQAARRALESGIEPLPMDFAVTEQSGRFVAGHRGIFQALTAGESAPGAAALGFHLAAARMALDVCTRIRDRESVNQVALSGGVFQNRLLLGESLKLLRANGFKVYINHLVPPNDGGLALGQAHVACRTPGL